MNQVNVLKKCVCILLLATFCLSAMVGCSLFKGNEEESTDIPASDVQATDTDSETLNDGDDLGEYDFGGAKYNILSRESTVREWDHNKNDLGATVANAVYLRNQLVEERFKVDITTEEIGGWWNNDWGKSPWFAKYGTITQSGWSEYSIATGHFSLAQCAAVRGYCMDMTTLEGLDVTKEWWSEQFYEKCNLKGKFYVVVGDATYSMYEEMYVVFFNETLAETTLKDANGEPIDLYDLVRNDEWTWEKMKKYMLAINDTSSMMEEDKEYGYVGTNGSMRVYSSAFELEYAESDVVDGYLIYRFAQSPNARTVNVLDDMSSFFKTSAVNSVKLKASDSDGNQIFSEGRTLFYTQRLGQITKLAEAMSNGQNYGILPYPMYDEDQLEYHTDCYDGVSGITAPRNIKDTEMVGVITEAIGMYSYQEIRPAYLDTVLGGRYLADQDLSDMVNLIRESFDIGFFNAYSGAIGTPHVFSATDSMFSSSNGQGYASYYAANLSQYTANLAAFYKAYGIKVD